MEEVSVIGLGVYPSTSKRANARETTGHTTSFCKVDKSEANPVLESESPVNCVEASDRVRGGSGGADADYGEKAAGLGALFTVAEEEVGAAGGAEVACEDVLWGEAGGQKLGAIGFLQVEVDVFGRGLVAWRHHVEPLDWIRLVAGAEFVEPVGGVGELGLELGGDFGADFIAAGADGRTDRGEEASGIGGEVHLHLADGFFGNAGEGAAPAGVDGGYGALFGIDEEDRDTVGGLDAEQEAGTVGGGGVTLAWFLRGSFDEMDNVGVDLFEGDELEVARAEGGLEAAAVFEDVFTGVPVGETEVQDFFAV
jgi:hypothetical protein